jgi:glycogen operon protein
VIDYIRSLGITAIELMPVHAFISEGHLVGRELTNYWGYNSIGFFAPDVRYNSDPANGLREFKEMVARFHDAGLEVILDVVYNHTAEGNERGPTVSFRGIDNASYYRLVPDNPRYYYNDTGTGNTLNLRHPRVTQMITDSLRYWVTDMHVDGFRFDLGTTLARQGEQFDDHAGFLTACIQDPILASVKMIAEPWDCGPGGYQVGSFPPGWAEWNDTYRNAVRDFWRGAVPVGVLAPALCASAGVFNRRGRKPWASVNFVTAHDGFTMHDLVSYNEKHNEANGEQNADGASENRSCNYGAEGPTDSASILAVRLRQMKNMIATLLFAQGTPMMLAGDERGRTQGGNNNAYCQDNETSWMDWTDTPEADQLLAHVRRCTRIRREHPALCQSRFLTGEVLDGMMKDVTWLQPSGVEMTGDAWVDGNARCFGMQLVAWTDREAPDRLLCIVNADTEPINFVLPRCYPGECWAVLVDSLAEAGETETLAGGATLTALSRALYLLESQPARSATGGRT